MEFKTHLDKLATLPLYGKCTIPNILMEEAIANRTAEELPLGGDGAVVELEEDKEDDDELRPGSDSESGGVIELEEEE